MPFVKTPTYSLSGTAISHFSPFYYIVLIFYTDRWKLEIIKLLWRGTRGPSLTSVPNPRLPQELHCGTNYRLLHSQQAEPQNVLQDLLLVAHRRRP